MRGASRFDAGQSAFTLIEVMFGVVVMGIMFVVLYSGIEFGLQEIRLARENSRATQILQEKMEVVRLFNWDQLVNLPGYIPTAFTAPFYASNPTNPPVGSFNYTGTVVVTNAPLSETYAGDMRMIQVNVSWVSRGHAHSRQVSTFISQYGLQKYVY